MFLIDDQTVSTEIPETKKESARTALKRMESNMTKEELEEEASTRLEQLASIMKILHEQQAKIGVDDESDLKSQLKMYM